MIRTPMKIRAFDKEVVAANGLEVVTRGGVQQLVRKGAGPEAEPLGRIDGDCGYSYIYVSGGNNIYYFNTGFHVNTSAVSYSWNVDMDGPWGYSRNWGFGGALAFTQDWTSGTRSSVVDDTGWYSGEVVVPSSWAMLWNGSVCYSGGPSDRGEVW